MKAFVFSTGALSASLTIIGMLFKIMHWPYASILLVTGLGILALLFVPAFAKYKFNTEK